MSFSGGPYSAPPSHYFCSTGNVVAECPAADTFLYLGSDIDVQMLRLLQPSETNVIFWDTMKQEGLEAWFAEYDKDWRDDTRRSYKETSLPLRPLDRSNPAAIHRFGELVLRRMRETEAISNVTANLPQLRFNFVLHGRRRRLRYVLDALHNWYPAPADMGGERTIFDSRHDDPFTLLSSDDGAGSHRGTSFIPSVSTIAHPAFWPGEYTFRTLIDELAPSCLPRVRLLSTSDIPTTELGR
jgi:hypothetical protein